MQAKPVLVLDARKAYDSGIGTYIRNLIPFLKEEFTLRLIGEEDQLSVFGTDIIAVNAKPYSVQDFYLPALVARNADIFWTPHFNFPLLPTKALLRVATVHDLYHIAHWKLLTLKQKMVYRLFMQNICWQTDLVFTVSDFTKGEMQKYYPEMLSKTKRIHLGVDAAHFTNLNIFQPQDFKKQYGLPDQYILFVGNLKPNKNVITLLKAYKMWTEAAGEQKIKIVITGKKEGFRIGDNEATDFILKENLSESVVFTGFVPENDLTSMYRNAWLFVFPSLYEGFGLPPLEAMACGCPVACSESASIPEICQDKVFYFNGNKPDELKELLVRLHADNQLRLSKSESALQFVKQYNWEVAAEKHIRLLKNALEVKF